MLEIILMGIILITYIGILCSISKERPKPKFLIFCLIIFLMSTICIAGIEIHNTYNIPATFGFEGHDYTINSQGIIEHSINCHCYD